MGCLWLFRARPWAKVCEWSDQLPIIKLSLTAAYLWFLRPVCHCQFSIDMALLVFPLL